MSCDPVLVGTTIKEGEGILICEELALSASGNKHAVVGPACVRITGLIFCGTVQRVSNVEQTA